MTALLSVWPKDGSYYYYVPDTAEVADYVTELQPGDIEGQALGGEPQAAPWWMGALQTVLMHFLGWSGLAGVGAAAAFIFNHDDDDNNNDSGTVVDSDAPDAPTLNVNEDGTAVTGEAEAGLQPLKLTLMVMETLTTAPPLMKMVVSPLSLTSHYPMVRR